MSRGHPRASNASGGGYKGRISTNLMRGNLTKGQQAMAMMYPDPAKHQRGIKNLQNLKVSTRDASLKPVPVFHWVVSSSSSSAACN
jgi:hypothetical protein